MLGASTRSFTFEGGEYTVTLNMPVIARFEGEHGYSIIDVVAPPGGGNPMISRLYLLLEAALEPRHPELSDETLERMISHKDALEALLAAVKAALPVEGDVAGQAPGNGGNRARRRAAATKPRGGKTG